MRIHKLVNLIKQADVIRAVDGTVEYDVIAALFVDADVEIAHAAFELLGKIQVLRFGIPRHTETTAVVRPRYRKVGDGGVVGYVVHPFRKINVRLRAVTRYHFVALDDNRRENDGKQRYKSEKTPYDDERNLAFFTPCKFFLLLFARFFGGGAAVFRHTVCRCEIVIFHNSLPIRCNFNSTAGNSQYARVLLYVCARYAACTDVRVRVARVCAQRPYACRTECARKDGQKKTPRKNRGVRLNDFIQREFPLREPLRSSSCE